MSAAYLTPTEAAIFRILQEADAPIRGRELLGRATGAAIFIGGCETHISNLRAKSVPIGTVHGAGYYLVGQYEPPKREPRRRLRSERVVVDPAPMLAVLTECYSRMRVARAMKAKVAA